MGNIILTFKADDSPTFRTPQSFSSSEMIFKILIYKRKQLFIEQTKLLSTSQYGFCKVHSTPHVILDVVNVCNEVFTKSSQLVIFS